MGSPALKHSYLRWLVAWGFYVGRDRAVAIGLGSATTRYNFVECE